MIRRWVVSLCIPLAVVATPPVDAQTATPETGSAVVARVGDVAITLEEIERKWRESDPASFIQTAQTRYDALQRFVDLAIGDRLIAQEAEAQGVSVAALLERELPSRTAPITDADIEAMYNGLGAQTQGRSLDQLREPVRNFLQQQRPAKARAQYVEELKNRSDSPIRILLDPPRQEITVAVTDPVKGPASASVEIIEFSDFQ